MRISYVMLCLPLLVSVTAAAQDIRMEHAVNTGVSGLWVLANISFAGMRAQSNRSRGWRILAFIFGLPGTLVSLLAVDEGSERAYGIDLPCKR